ncbi:hypothetical protein OAH18_00340 [bacterium]|nr:hypothetical protein [bacterium]
MQVRGTKTTTKHSDADQHLLWIDGVGCWLLCTSDSVSIGGPSTSGETADIRLMANLSRRHVEFKRQGEGYIIHPVAETRVNDRSIYEPSALGNDYEIKLGLTCRLGFRLPTALSSSAVVDFKSGHRPAHSVDGIVLMSDNCLLGSGSDNHIQCEGWPSPVVLFKRDGKVCCKSREPLMLDGKPIKDYAVLTSGSVISGEELQFRIEQIQPHT